MVFYKSLKSKTKNFKKFFLRVLITDSNAANGFKQQTLTMPKLLWET